MLRIEEGQEQNIRKQEMPAKKTSPQRKKKHLERLEERKIQIIREAVAIFVAKGYEGTTMDEIAEACGISKGSLYTSVGSKENLIFLIQEYVIEGYRKEAARIEEELSVIGPVEAIRQLIAVYLKTVDTRQDAYNFLLHVSMRLDKPGRVKLLKVTAGVYADFERILSAGVEAGVFKMENPKLIAHHIVFLSTAWARDKWHLQKMMSFNAYVKSTTALAMKLVGVDGR
jgi:AcrR family transcriptional regulator